MPTLERSHEGLVEALDLLARLPRNQGEQLAAVICFHLGLPYGDLQEVINSRMPEDEPLPSFEELNGVVSRRAVDPFARFRYAIAHMDDNRNRRERWVELLRVSRIKPKALLGRPAEDAR